MEAGTHQLCVAGMVDKLRTSSNIGKHSSPSGLHCLWLPLFTRLTATMNYNRVLKGEREKMWTKRKVESGTTESPLSGWWRGLMARERWAFFPIRAVVPLGVFSCVHLRMGTVVSRTCLTFARCRRIAMGPGRRSLCQAMRALRSHPLLHWYQASRQYYWCFRNVTSSLDWSNQAINPSQLDVSMEVSKLD